MTKTAGFDISEIKSQDRTIEITHPGTGENLGIRVTLMSIDDERLQKIKRSITDRRLHLEARGKTLRADEIEENKITIYATSITGWEWYALSEGIAPVLFHGDIPEFNRRNVVAVLTELTWFADQINAELNETKAFFGRSKLS